MPDLHLKVSKLYEKRIDFVCTAASFCCSRFNTFPSSISAREKTIDYLVCEIGQKLSVRVAPEKGYLRRTSVKVPMDHEVFEDLFSGLSRGRSKFDVTAEDLDNLLPAGWSEPAPNVSFVGSNPYLFALLIKESYTTTIQSVPAASGQEMARNRHCAKQGRPGRLISVICS